ncbi:MAG: hypothetical protein M3247_09300 [Thermoproteota archaeon]|nr:hypothetical protein [Thermoproteota archaeon]
MKNNSNDHFVFSWAFIVIILIASIAATPYITRVSFARLSSQANSIYRGLPATSSSVIKQAQQLQHKQTSKPTSTAPPTTSKQAQQQQQQQRSKPTSTAPPTALPASTAPPPTHTTTASGAIPPNAPPATSTAAAPTAAATASSTSQNVKGPVKVAFVDSYWTDNTAPEAVVADSSSSGTTTIPPVVRQEVGTGEGPSTLVVVLVNRGFSDISGVTGSLQLPSEFQPIINPRRSSIPGVASNAALTTYNGIVSAGQTFTLYFAVNVSKDAQVGEQYLGDLKIGYFDVSEQNSKDFRSETIRAPFMLPGKVVLDAVSGGSGSSFSPVQTLTLVPACPMC